MSRVYRQTALTSYTVDCTLIHHRTLLTVAVHQSGIHKAAQHQAALQLIGQLRGGGAQQGQPAGRLQLGQGQRDQLVGQLLPGARGDDRIEGAVGVGGCEPNASVRMHAMWWASVTFYLRLFAGNSRP